MELFTRLFGDLLTLVYHCFDRIVIHGYLSGLSRPQQVVYFVRQVLSIPVVSKEVLRQRTNGLPRLGGSLRPQSQDPDGVGGERPPQRGLRTTCATPYGEAWRLRRLFHLQEDGTGPHLPHQRAEVSHP
jgi:hypothetical protein